MIDMVKKVAWKCYAQRSLIFTTYTNKRDPSFIPFSVITLLLVK